MVDDHAAILNMMMAIVRDTPGFEVVGGAVDASEALRICRTTPVDVAVLDLFLPDLSGTLLLNQLRSIQPQLRVLVFSGNLSLSTMRELLVNGVLGVVEKSASLKMFIDALRAVARGQTYFSTDAGNLIRQCIAPSPSHEIPLTDREKLVLGLIAHGLSSKEIADQLGLSLHTVINQRSILMRKTGLRRVAQLSLYAAQRGLLGAKSDRE